ncbi:MAG: hypothetical protein V1899_05905 [Planctomycetota bacterium]
MLTCRLQIFFVITGIVAAATFTGWTGYVLGCKAGRESSPVEGERPTVDIIRHTDKIPVSVTEKKPENSTYMVESASPPKRNFVNVDLDCRGFNFRWLPTAPSISVPAPYTPTIAESDAKYSADVRKVIEIKAPSAFLTDTEYLAVIRAEITVPRYSEWLLIDTLFMKNGIVVETYYYDKKDQNKISNGMLDITGKIELIKVRRAFYSQTVYLVLKKTLEQNQIDGLPSVGCAGIRRSINTIPVFWDNKTMIRQYNSRNPDTYFGPWHFEIVSRHKVDQAETWSHAFSVSGIAAVNDIRYVYVLLSIARVSQPLAEALSLPASWRVDDPPTLRVEEFQAKDYLKHPIEWEKALTHS